MMNPQATVNKKIFSFLGILSMVIVIMIPASAQTKREIMVSEKEPVSLAHYDGEFVFGSGQYPDGNPSCALLNALDDEVDGNPSDPNFAHMSFDWEFRLNFTSPNGSYALVNSGSPETIVSGGMDENPNLFLDIVSSGNTMTSWTLQPSNQIDRKVTAVIVKGGANATVYTYTEGAAFDSGVFQTPPTGGGPLPAISHLSFCFEPGGAVTAANGTISGRAIKMDGTGIASARIEVLNLSTGEIRNSITNPFGYYNFEGIETNDLYMVTVSHKRHQFANPQRTISFDGDIVDLDFVAF